MPKIQQAPSICSSMKHHGAIGRPDKKNLQTSDRLAKTCQPPRKVADTPRLHAATAAGTPRRNVTKTTTTGSGRPTGG